MSHASTHRKLEIFWPLFSETSRYFVSRFVCSSALWGVELLAGTAGSVDARNVAGNPKQHSVSYAFSPYEEVAALLAKTIVLRA